MSGAATTRLNVTRLALLFAYVLVFGLARARADVGAATCVHDVCFEPTLQVDGVTLPLAGVSLMRYYGFRLYVAALYAHKENASAQAIVRPVQKALVLHYLRSFTPDDFKKSGRKFMQKNPEVDLAKLESEVAQMDALYQPVEEGDRYTLIFSPAVSSSNNGTTALVLNGKELGRVTGNAFQAAYFGIWLSQYSAKESFTRNLFQLPKLANE